MLAGSNTKLKSWTERMLKGKVRSQMISGLRVYLKSAFAVPKVNRMKTRIKSIRSKIRE